MPAASSTLQIDPASHSSSSVQRRRMRSSSGRSENSPARSSATAMSPAARTAGLSWRCGRGGSTVPANGPP
ncbi:MAG: hypothetical protein ACRDRJ_30990 [Streptosporangiaceae bacterium]